MHYLGTTAEVLEKTKKFKTSLIYFLNQEDDYKVARQRSVCFC